MANSMFWLDVDGDRTGLEIVVNGIPADRLLKSHGQKMPINEYLVQGTNRVEVRRSLWQSDAPDDEAGKVSATLVHAMFNTTTKAGEDTVFDQSAEFAASPPSAVLLSASFSADVAGLGPLGGFEPIGPSQQQAILERLAQVARYWRDGDGDGLVRWMQGYMDEYVRCYPLENAAVMADRVRRMAAAFRSGKVQFDPASTLLNAIPGANLVDCISPQGAAVRVSRSNGPDYDMWAVVGVRGGEVVLVR